MNEVMRPVFSALFCLTIWTVLAGPAPAGEAPDLWTSRVGAFLGPQYFLEHDDLVQFSFGAEGHWRLVGPLALGVALGLGVIDDSCASGQASLRLHLLRKNQLSLGLDLRGGVLFWLADDSSRVEPIVQSGLELVHDLGDSFWILVRAGLGWVPGDDRGALADLTIGLGFYI